MFQKSLYCRKLSVCDISKNLIRFEPSAIQYSFLSPLRPLYILYVQASAYGEACGEYLFSMLTEYFIRHSGRYEVIQMVCWGGKLVYSFHGMYHTLYYPKDC